MGARATPVLRHAELYERDYHTWIEQQAELLQGGRVSELDTVNLAEEVADIGRREKRAVRGNLRIVLAHLLKYQFQPRKRSRSWRLSLLEHRQRLADLFSDSPSIHPNERELEKIYRDAKALAATETDLPLKSFPEACPYSLEQVLDHNFLPDT